MAKLIYLFCLITITTAQVEFDDNSWTRDLDEAIFGSNKRTITIFSNFNNPADQQFFQNTLPWIVDSIGNYLKINYRFRNSARRAGPRACALRSLRTNTYTQAEYLRCESLGNPSLTCVDQAPINRRTYNRCLNERVNEYVRTSEWEFDGLQSDQTPIIRMGRRREFNANNPERLLRLICQSFGRTKPPGCLRPRAFPAGPAAAPRNIPAPSNILQVIDSVENPSPRISAESKNVLAVTRNKDISAPAKENQISLLPYNDDEDFYGFSSANRQSNASQLGLHIITLMILSCLTNSNL